MKFPELVCGEFVQRDNRFRATVPVNGQEVKAYVRNSGGLWDLFIEGQTVWLAPVVGVGRKTAYDLKLVELESGLVSVDAHLPNHLFAEAVREGRLSAFRYQEIKGEVYSSESRLDFYLAGSDDQVLGTSKVPPTPRAGWRPNLSRWWKKGSPCFLTCPRNEAADICKN